MIDADVNIQTATLPGAELHEFLRWARETGDIVRLPFMESHAYLVSGYDDVKHAFVDDEHFPGELIYQVALEPLVGETFVSMEMARHNVYRQLATPAFKSRAIGRFVDEQLVPLANEVVDSFYAKGEADLVTVLARSLPTYAICRKLGLPMEDEQRLRELAFAMFGRRPTGITPEEANRQIDDRDPGQRDRPRADPDRDEQRVRHRHRQARHRPDRSRSTGLARRVGPRARR